MNQNNEHSLLDKMSDYIQKSEKYDNELEQATTKIANEVLLILQKIILFDDDINYLIDCLYQRLLILKKIYPNINVRFFSEPKYIVNLTKYGLQSNETYSHERTLALLNDIREEYADGIDVIEEFEKLFGITL